MYSYRRVYLRGVSCKFNSIYTNSFMYDKIILHKKLFTLNFYAASWEENLNVF